MLAIIVVVEVDDHNNNAGKKLEDFSDWEEIEAVLASWYSV